MQDHVCQSGPMSEPATEWYWDLGKGVAIPADQRGPADQLLGPYPTKGEAENWKATVESRNESWDDADEEWNRWGDDEGEAAP